MAKATRRVARKRRHLRVRRKLFGTAERPRLNVYRSINHIYAQVIDDQTGRTLASASTIDRDLRGDLEELDAVERAKRVGIALAERAKSAGIGTVVFDRGGFPYHGQVRAVAEGSREGGLEF